MQSLYTETLQEFLTNNEDNTEWTTFKQRMIDNFPSFVIDETNNLSFYDLFVRRFIFREIGRETEELFYNSLVKKFDEITIKYIDKVKLYTENVSGLMTFKIGLKEEEEYFDYLNPSTAVTANLNVDTAFRRTRDYERFLSPMTDKVSLLAKLIDLKSIYMEALTEFETCFMGCF